jgi:ubiquinone/menaquinone biosynthesis C-methylase UbiE
MDMMTATPPKQVTNPLAWNRFCELVARGGGVSDHPGNYSEQIKHASSVFFQLEINRVEHHRKNLIPFLIDHCKLAGLKVLEFGAGTGGLSVAMAQAGVAAIESVEPVEINCEAGRWRTKAYGLEDTIHFHHVANTRHLPFSNQTFDAVVCSSVLQYIPDANQRRILLTEMARVTRVGGLLIFCASGNGIYPAGPHSSHWWSNLFPDRASQLGHNRGISHWEFNKSLNPLGFRIHPQGIASLNRWQRRMAARCHSLQSKIALLIIMNLFRMLGPLIGLATRAPLEAFLPYPDLAYRLEFNPDAASMYPKLADKKSTRAIRNNTQNAARTLIKSIYDNSG